DPDAGLDEQAPEASRQTSGVDGCGVGDQHPAPEPRRPAPLLDLARAEELVFVLDAERARGLERALPGPLVPVVRRDGEVAAVSEPRVDAVRPAPRPDLGRRAAARH